MQNQMYFDPMFMNMMMQQQGNPNMMGGYPGNN